MAGFACLMDVLRAKGLQNLAPSLMTTSIRSICDLTDRKSEALQAGLTEEQIRILTDSQRGSGIEVLPDDPPGRWDHPPVLRRANASLEEALSAARPEHRAAAIASLTGDVLAPSSQKPNDSRVKTWLQICQAWGVDPWPIRKENLQCFAASLKWGKYRSFEQYIAAVITYQSRAFGEELTPPLRRLTRDLTRSVKRGLGPSQIKDSFAVVDLSKLVEPSRPVGPFSFSEIDSAVDIVIVGCCFMTREIELSSARAEHLTLSGEEVSIMLPCHKSESRGDLTQRSFRCACRVQAQPLCPYHAAVRHHNRLLGRFGPPAGSSPLVPTDDGLHHSKADMVQGFRSVIQAAGVPLTRKDESNIDSHRFHGHVLRISGAQFLYRIGLTFAQIQLQGRWASNTVLRYLQQAPLLGLSEDAAEGLQAAEETSTKRPRKSRPTPAADEVVASRQVSPAGHSTHGGQAAVSPGAAQESSQPQQHSQSAVEVQALQSEVSLIRALIETETSLIVQARSRVAHSIAKAERMHEPHEWMTSCGWKYAGCKYFRATVLRDGTRHCKRCFPPTAADSTPSSPTSSNSSELGDSSSSS